MTFGASNSYWIILRVCVRACVCLCCRPWCYWTRRAARWLLWTLSPGGYAAWPAAPASPPDEPSDPARPVELSATAYCVPEPGPGSPDTPACAHTQNQKSAEAYFFGKKCMVWSCTPHLKTRKQEVEVEKRLTLIMALDVMRNSVALSVTCRILSLVSPPSLMLSSSDKDLRETMSTRTYRTDSQNKKTGLRGGANLWRAEPCLAMRSLHVLRSSTLLPRVLSVDWTSELRVPTPWAAIGGEEVHSSPESSE